MLCLARFYSLRDEPSEALLTAFCQQPFLPISPVGKLPDGQISTRRARPLSSASAKNISLRGLLEAALSILAVLPACACSAVKKLNDRRSFLTLEKIAIVGPVYARGSADGRDKMPALARWHVERCNETRANRQVDAAHGASQGF
jgi:hypothetical protein